MRSSVGGLAPLGDGAEGVLVERDVRVHHRLQLFLGGVAAQRLHQVVRPLQEDVALLRPDPEHVADDRHRERGGQLGDEVAFPLLAHRVDQLIADLADPADLRLHLLAGEAGVHQASTLQVRGVVHVDHLRQRPGLRADTARVGEQARVSFGGDQRLARRRGRHTVPVPEHRLIGPHPGIRRAGVARPARIEAAVEQIGLVHDRHPRAPSSERTNRKASTITQTCPDSRTCSYDRAGYRTHEGRRDGF